MMNFGQIDCKEIIVRLANDFWAKQKGELTKKVGEISQDFIDKGLYKSTARVGKLVHIHYDYIAKLLDFLIQSLEKDYQHLSPIKCKPHLLDIVEREFANLTCKVPGWLHESQLLDKGTRISFEDSVQKKKKEVKGHLENRRSLWEQRWNKRRRFWRNSTFWAATGVIVMIILAVLSWFVPRWLFGPETPSKIIRDTPIDPNTGKTALYARTKKRVDELRDFLIKEKITPWLLMKSGDRVTNHDGRILQYSDVEFTGTPRQIFWEGFIEPFLEDGIQDVLDEVGAECKNMGLDPENPLKEATWLLRSVIESVYKNMAKVDQTLRGKGYPDSVRRKNVDYEIRIMENKLQEYLKVALVLYGKAPE